MLSVSEQQHLISIVTKSVSKIDIFGNIILDLVKKNIHHYIKCFDSYSLSEELKSLNIPSLIRFNGIISWFEFEQDEQDELVIKRIFMRITKTGELKHNDIKYTCPEFSFWNPVCVNSCDGLDCQNCIDYTKRNLDGFLIMFFYKEFVSMQDLANMIKIFTPQY